MESTGGPRRKVRQPLNRVQLLESMALTATRCDRWIYPIICLLVVCKLQLPPLMADDLCDHNASVSTDNLAYLYACFLRIAVW